MLRWVRDPVVRQWTVRIMVATAALYFVLAIVYWASSLLVIVDAYSVAAVGGIAMVWLAWRMLQVPLRGEKLMRSSKVTARSDKRNAAPREKKWERRSDARPSELVAAALRLFAERGFAATRLEDVALAAGVSKGTVYLYFENKERLFEAAIRAAITPKVERADALVDAFEGTTPNLLRTILTVFASELDGALPAVVKPIVARSGNSPGPRGGRWLGSTTARPDPP